MQRRNFLSSSLTALGASTILTGCQSSTPAQRWQKGASRWPICLDTATLSKDISLERKVELAAAAGFDAIEPWDRELKAHEDSGKSLKDLGKKIKDLGMFVPVLSVFGGLGSNKEDFNKNIDQIKSAWK